MKRLLTACVWFGVFLLIDGSLALAQEGPTKVKYRLHVEGKDDKLEEVTGTLKKESIAGLVILAKGGEKTLPAFDIVDVEYPAPSFELSAMLRKARNTETKNVKEALEMYKQALPKINEPKLKRHTEYKIAFLLSELAKRDDSLVKPAIDSLLKFKASHPDSWQFINFPNLLVPLQLKDGDPVAAQQTLAELAAEAKLPAEFRQKCNQMGAELLVKAKKYAEAEKTLRELIKPLPPNDPQAIRLRLTLAECFVANKKLNEAEKEIEAVIAKATNPDTKALAFNTLGECYLGMGDAQKAKWNFLFVHVLYKENKEEHARALYHLSKLFKKLNDDRKAQQFRDLLKNDKQLAGKYQDMAEKEK